MILHVLKWRRIPWLPNTTVFFLGTVFSLLVLSSPTLAEEEKTMVKRIAGQVGEHGVRLIWSLQKWPADWRGMWVVRREIGSPDSEWQKLNSEPVVPMTLAAEHWTKFVRRPVVLEELQKELKRLQGDPRAKFFFPRPWLENEAKRIDVQAVKGGAEALAFALGHAIYQDYNTAFFLGTGFFDSTVKEGKRYEYGLVPVFVGEEKAPLDEPIALCNPFVDPRSAELQVPKYKVLEFQGKVKVRFEVKQETCQKYNFRTVALYRLVDNQDKRWKEIGRVYVGADGGVGSIKDKEVQFASNQTYKLVPVNAFGDEYRATVIHHTPDSVKQQGRPKERDFEGGGVSAPQSTPISGSTDERLSKNALRKIVKRFSGNYDELGVRLVWSLQKWPADWQGMWVVRRELGREQGDWQRLNEVPIYPRTLATRAWERLVDTPEAKLYYGKKLKSFKKRTKEKFFPPPWLEEKPGPIPLEDSDLEREKMCYGLAYPISLDVDAGVFVGAGYFDSSFSEGKKYLYGLVPVYGGSDKTKAVEPLVVVNPFVDPQSSELEFTKAAAKKEDEDTISLSLEVDPAIAKKYCFINVKVDRLISRNPDQWIRLADDFYVRHSGRTSDVDDTDADPNQKQVYRLTPINDFGKEYRSTVVTYEPPEPEPEDLDGLVHDDLDGLIHRFQGTHDELGVRLVWSLQNWPSNWRGMWIVRKELGAEGAQWVRINENPVYPRTLATRAWETFVDTPEAKEYYRRKMTQFLKSDKTIFPKPWLASKKGGLEMAETEIGRKKLQFALAYPLTIDVDTGVFIGAGYFDSHFKPERQYMYGLVPQYAEDEPELQKPVAICYPFVDPNAEVLTFKNVQLSRKDQGVKISLKVPRNVAAKFGFSTVRVERAIRKNGAQRKWEKLDDYMYVDTDGWASKFTDKQANPNQKQVYRLIPINDFGKKYRSTVVTYEPAKPEPEDLEEPGETLIIRFVGSKQDEMVKLVWHVTRWPENWRGMWVLRRDMHGASVDEWEVLNKKPIYPKPLASEAWRDSVKGKKAMKKYEQILGRLLKKQKSEKEPEPGTSKPFFDPWMAAAETEILPGIDGLDEETLILAIAVSLMQNLDLAVFYGVGFVDGDLPAGRKFEYGIVPAFGLVKPENPRPEATCTPFVDPTDPKLAVRNCTFSKAMHGLRIEVNMPPAVLKRFGFDKFQVFRKNAGQHRFQPVETLGLSEESGRGLMIDEDADPTVKTHYKFVPTTIFGKEYRSTVVTYKPPEPEPEPEEDPLWSKLGKPTLLMFGRWQDGRIFARWNYDKKPDFDVVKGFQIEVGTRANRDKWGETVYTSEVLPPRIMRFKGPVLELEYNKPYIGRINLILSNGEIRREPGWSNQFKVHPPVIIPPVEDFQAKMMLENKKRFVRMTWDVPEEVKDRLSYFRLISDAWKEGEVVVMGSLPRIKESHFDLPFSNWKKRDLTVGVCVVTKNGRVSDYVKKTLKDLPGHDVPPPTNLRREDPSPNGIYATLAWDYDPSKAPSLDGFRVYRQISNADYVEGVAEGPRKLLVDESELSAAARSIRLGPHVNYVRYWYYVHAVNKLGGQSQHAPGIWFKHPGGYKTKPGITELTKTVEDLQASLDIHEAGPIALVGTWSFPEQERDLVQGYQVRVKPPAATTAELPLRVDPERVHLPIRADYQGDVELLVSPIHYRGKVYEPVAVSVTVQPRTPPDYFPRRTVIIYSAVASGLVFVVLCVGLYRRLRRHSDKKEAA